MNASQFFSLIRVKESFFSLPLVFCGCLFAWDRLYPKTPPTILWLWVVLAVFSLRSAGMCFNRVIDKEIDAKNPRTAHRLLCKSTIASGYVWAIAWLWGLVFVALCYCINPLCGACSPFLLLLAFVYAYCKRFTHWGHVVLATLQFFAPVMAFIAFVGEPHPGVVALGLGTFCWMFGNDLIYQTQDLSHDLTHGIYNLCVWLGKQKSYGLAALLHGLSLAFFVLAGGLSDFSFSYYFGVAVVFFLYLSSYRLLIEEGLEKIHRIFFTNNIFISFTMLVFTFLDFVWRKLL